MKKKIKALNKKKTKTDTVGGLIFVGCLMLGIGFGISSGNAGAGTLIGLGIGFVVFGLIKAYMKD